MERQNVAHAFGKDFRFIEVGHAHAAAGHLVFVRGADAAARRTDLVSAQRRLSGMIKRYMVRHDERTVGGHAHAGFRIHAVALEFVDFLKERFGRKDDAVTQVADRRRVHDAGRDEAQNRLIAVDDKRMPGVVAAVETNDAVDLLREPVDNLTFAFVTPLGTDHHYVFRHFQ